MQLRMSIRHPLVSARRAAMALVAMAGVAGCSTESLLEVRDPDIINPADVQSAAAANALRLGALARLASATSGGGAGGNGGESSVVLGGLLADEWRSSDTFNQRNETDRRTIQTTNSIVDPAFRSLYRARLGAEQAITALREFDAPGWQVAQMYLIQAFVENQLGHDFCGHIPFSTVVDGREQLGTALTTAATFERALAHADSGLAEISGTTANDVAMRNALSVLKGRILVNLERYADAAIAVNGVPGNYQFVVEHSANTTTNAIWGLNQNHGRFYVSQGEGTNGLNFAADPRTPTCYIAGTAANANGTPQGCNADTPIRKPFDPTTPVINGATLLVQQKWPSRYQSVAILTGTEARLIAAEAQLAAGQAAAALQTLNDLRATRTGLAPLTLAATAEARVDQLFDERAYWLWGTGTRLNDLRRLIRDYGRTADDVFPVGSWWKGGTYGNDVNLPVPQSEENNPNFTRASCVSTAA